MWDWYSAKKTEEKAAIHDFIKLKGGRIFDVVVKGKFGFGSFDEALKLFAKPFTSGRVLILPEF